MTAPTLHLLRRMKRRPLRALLTLLQILLGSAVLTLTLSLYFNAQRSHDPDTFYLTSGELLENSSTYTMLLLERDFPEILKLAPDVESISVFETNIFEDTARYEDQGYAFTRLAAVSPSYFDIVGLSPSRGHFFGAAERSARELEVVMSDEAAQIVFGAVNPVGQELRFDSGRYRVIGTFAEAAKNRDPFVDAPPSLFFPTWSGVAGFSYSSAVVKAKPGRGEAAKAQTLAAARSVYKNAITANQNDPETFFYTSNLEQGAYRFSLLNPLFIVLAMFSAVAVMVVAIGLFSATVTDLGTRGREQAIKRSLGASGRRIRSEVVLEAALQAALGALLGVGTVALFVPVLRERFTVSSTPFTWEPAVALGVVLGVVLLGAGSSFFPAVQASRERITQSLGGA